VVVEDFIVPASNIISAAHVLPHIANPREFDTHHNLPRIHRQIGIIKRPIY
jgi:hypothetical protein